MDSKTLHLQRLAKGNGLRDSRLDELQLGRRKASPEQDAELGAFRVLPDDRQLSFSENLQVPSSVFAYPRRQRGSWSGWQLETQEQAGGVGPGQPH